MIGTILAKLNQKLVLDMYGPAPVYGPQPVQPTLVTWILNNIVWIISFVIALFLGILVILLKRKKK